MWFVLDSFLAWSVETAGLGGQMKELKPLIIASVAALGLVAGAFAASAANRFDGRWVVDAPAAGGAIGAEGQYICPALRLPLEVKNGEVTGTLERTQGNEIVAGNTNPSAAPVSGTVSPNGTVNVMWLNFHATGKLSGNSGKVEWSGECGPRVATATRVKG
jgi:hypothetical protein